MQLFRQIASNTLWQIFARITSSGVSFLITIIIARNLGISGYGDLAKITAFVSLFYLFVDLGLNAVFLQLEEHEKRFTDLLSFRLVLSCVLFFLVASISFFLPFHTQTGIGYSPLVKIGILLLSLTFFGRALTFSAAVLFQKRYAYRLGTYASLLGSLVTLSLVVETLLLHLPFLVLIAGYIGGAFVEGISSLIFAREKIIPFSMDTSFIKQMTVQTLPITLMLFLNLIYFRIDMIILSVLKPTVDVAVYDFAYKFFDFLIALPLFLSNSLYPMLLASEKNMRIVFPKLIVYVLGFTFLGILIAIPVWFASPLLAFIKKDFAAASFALRLLLLSLPIFFATNIVQWIFIAKKKQAFLVWVYGGSLLLNILLNVIFIPQYSYVASAIITGVSEAVVLVALLAYNLFARL